jgi:hypothetical protein
MKGSVVESVLERGRILNAVALQNAVLRGECDVVSDTPHDQCMVCGSRSVFNIAGMLGSNLPRERAVLIGASQVDSEKTELVLTFSRTHRLQRKPPAPPAPRAPASPPYSRSGVSRNLTREIANGRHGSCP